jgi:hypothetical protein
VSGKRENEMSDVRLVADRQTQLTAREEEKARAIKRATELAQLHTLDAAKAINLARRLERVVQIAGREQPVGDSVASPEAREATFLSTYRKYHG